MVLGFILKFIGFRVSYSLGFLRVLAYTIWGFIGFRA